MNHYPQVKLQEIVSFKTGKLDSNASEIDGKYPFFTCSPETLRINSYAFDTSAILLAGNNATGVFPVKYYSGKFNCYQRTYVIENIAPKVANLRYLYFAIQLQLKFLQNMSIGSATKFLTMRILNNLKISLPVFSIQQKISDILSAYDDLIENNIKRIKLLEEMAQITYEEWFVRLRFPGHESTFINSDTGFPEEWRINALSTICEINKNSITTRNLPDKIRYIDISSAETGSYDTPQEIAFSEAPSRARRRVIFGDTIFSTVRPNRRVFSLILDNDPLLVASTGFAVLTPHQLQNFPFIYLTIAQQSFTDATIAVAGGAAYPAVNQTDFGKIKITVPTPELMNKFSEIIVSNFTLKRQLLRENRLLHEARDVLLPRLMTGIIDAESYNPADLLKEVA